MKKLNAISALLAAAFLVCGCVHEQLEMPEAPAEPPVEDRVDVTIGIQLPEPLTTKALGETPVISGLHLYVAVFDGSSDTLLEIVEAEKGTVADPTLISSGGTNYFHATIGAATNGTLRIVQLVASSAPLSDKFVSLNIGDNETTLGEKISVSGGVDSYWARLELDHIQNDSYTTGMLSNVPLVRNFAKVTVSVDESLSGNFQMVGFKVFNMPTSGMIAPVNVNKKLHYVDMLDDDGNVMHDAHGNVIKIPVKVNSSGVPILDDNSKYIYEYNHFADYTALPSPGAYASLTGTQPAGQEYWGYMPISVEWEDYSSEYSMTATGGTEPVYSRFLSSGAEYIYESTFNGDSNFPFIIIAGKYRSSSTEPWGGLTFYKADFVNASHEYYHILRNFHYNLNIEAVSGDGCTNIYEAVRSIAMNNFEGSVEAQELTNIADGQYQMFISKTSILNTSSDEVVLYLKNLQDTDSDGVYEADANSQLDVVWPLEASPSGKTVITASGKSDITLEAVSDASGDWAGWMKVTIPVEDPDHLNDGDVRTQNISFTNGRFTRTCEIRLRPPLPARVQCEPYVPGVKDTGMYIDILLSAGIRQDVFPLVFYLTMDDNTLYPDASGDGYPLLPVIPDPDHDSYYFQRTIEWDEYSAAHSDVNGLSTFRSYFKTSVAASATTVHLTWDEANDYFTGTVDGVTVDEDSFVNDRKTGNITFEYGIMQLSEGGSKTYLGTSNSGAQVSYFSADESVARVDESTGKVTAVAVGTTYIYATCPSKDEYTAVTGDSCRYTVEVVSGTVNEITMNWTGNPSLYVLNPGSTQTQATATATSGTPAITYSYTILEGPITSSGITFYPSTGQISFSSSSTGVVRVTATATVSASGYAAATQSIWYDIHVVSGSAPDGSVYYEEPFQDADHGLGLYTVSGTTNASLTHPEVWYLYTKEGDSSIIYGATASGYGNGQCYDTDASLLSTSIDLNAATTPVLEFQHAGNYFTDGDVNLMPEYVKVWYKCGSTSDVSSWSSSWVQGTISTFPSGYNWKYCQAYVPLTLSGGKYVQLRFQYTSDTSIAGTWEIKNVRIVENPTYTTNFPTVTINQPSGTGCSISATAGGSAVASGDQVAPGTTVTLTATAGTGYAFSSWNVTGANVANASSATTTFTMLTDNVTISAVYESVTTTSITFTSADTVTQDGVTVSFTDGTSATYYNSTYGVWIYQNGTMTISVPSGYELTGVSFVITYPSSYSSSNMSVSSGSFSISSNTLTWTPPATSTNTVTFTNNASSDVDVKTVTVSYRAISGGGGGGGGSATPLAPPTVTCSTHTSSSLTFSWAAVTNASSYSVSTDGGSTYTSVGSSTTYTWSELSASTSYTLYVKAIGDGVSYSDSAPGTCNQTTDAGGGGGTTTVNDVLNLSFTGVSASTTYAEWSGKTGTSGAVYAGQSAGDHSSIQLRSNNSNSGIVTTTSGGNVKKVVVSWNSNTTSGRTLNVYGKNTAYSAATDLYNTSTQGTLLGTIVYGTSTELTISGDYEYIGLRSSSGAMYLESITITWEQ